MFKKSLIAAAIAGFAFNASAALTVTNVHPGGADAEFDAANNRWLISQEGLPVTRVYTLADAANEGISIAFDTATAGAVVDGSILRLDVTGATFSGAGGTITPANHNNDTFAYNATVRPTSLYIDIGDGGDGIDIGNTTTLRLEDLPLLIDTDATAVAFTATLLTAASTPGITEAVVAGTASAARTAATVVTQWTARINPTANEDGAFDGIIDVADSRTQFTNDLVADNLLIDFATQGAGATPTSATITLTGDFSTNFDADGNSGVSDGTNDFAINAAGTTASFTYTAATTPNVATLLATDNHTITVTLDNTAGRANATIAERDYTYGIALGYQDAGSVARTATLVDTTAAGSWRLNGDDALISFMPFSSSFSQSITVTNTGTVDGEITVDWIVGGDTTTTVLEATAAPESVTDISNELRTLAAANGINGNASLRIVVNSPDGQIYVDALYYSISDNDRGVVAVDQNP